MSSVKLSVNLVHWTGSIYPMYFAARTCSQQNRKRPSQSEMECWLQENVINPGHLSILEFVDFHFLIKGGSRVFQQQLTRHRIASYAIESQRSTEYDKAMDYVMPPDIAENPFYAQRWQAQMKQAQEDYAFWLQAGIKAEDARYGLPTSVAGEINFKANGRELLLASHERLCNKAQWEIRSMFKQIVEMLDDICPLISGNMRPKCRFLGRCPEKKPCKKG